MNRAVHSLLDRGGTVDDLVNRTNDIAASSEQFRLMVLPWYNRWWDRCARGAMYPFYWLFRCCRAAFARKAPASPREK